MNILLTGGLGFIGSHTATVLFDANNRVVILDNLSNSQINVLDSLEKILGKRLDFIEGDVRDVNLVEQILMQYRIDIIIHFAGLKAVGESNILPVSYYSNNVSGIISVIQAMQKCGVRKIIFSSSATVYGDPSYLPCDEQHPTNPTNPYGRTKLQCEQILRDHSKANQDWSIICLRYFNPVGAHSSGLIGENPSGAPNNLMPFIAQVASGKLKSLNIFGGDYDTKDGTGERDYIHVMDLADGHASAIKYADSQSGFNVINLGSGVPISVLEMVATFERVTGKRIYYTVTDRRLGDIATSCAKPDLANKILSWRARYSLEDMCKSTWKYQQISHQAQ